MIDSKLNWNRDSYIESLRRDFSILESEVHGKPLVYLDNAATLQRPRAVLDCLQRFYTKYNSNVHRSVHYLSQEATLAYENTRDQIREFLNRKNQGEVVFTRGTTHSINLVSNGLRSWFRAGDSILITRMEHHANFVPWQQLCKKYDLQLLILELDADYRIDLHQLQQQLKKAPKLCAFSAGSNVLGTKNPLATMSKMAKDAGALVLADIAQSLAHFDYELGDPDFIAFSGHKLGGPTGIGCLWGKTGALELLEPSEFGGDMILEVRDEESRWNDLPWRLEAGTPNFADAIAMGEALQYLSSVDMNLVRAHEQSLVEEGLSALTEVEGLRIFGPGSSQDRFPIFSFTLDSIHPHDLGTFLDQEGIATRAGHHCAQPLHKHYGLSATTRASFAFYNTLGELEALVKALEKAKKFFRRRA